MKRLLALTLMAAVGIWLFGQPAQAQFFMNQVSELEDRDFEIFIDVDGSGDGSVGDYFLGMWQAQVINAMGSAQTMTSRLTAVFALELATTDVPDFDGGAFYPFEFTAKPATLKDLDNADGDNDPSTGTLEDPWDYYLGESRSSLNTIAKMFVDSIPPDIDNGVTLGNGIKDEIDTATDGTALYEFGFAGLANEFWYLASNANTGADLGVIYVANVNVTANLGGPLLLPHAWLDIVGHLSFPYTFLWPYFGGGDLFGQLQLQGSTTALDTTGDFDVVTDTNLYLYAVPEPASVAVWTLLAGALAAVAISRRRKKA